MVVVVISEPLRPTASCKELASKFAAAIATAMEIGVCSTVNEQSNRGGIRGRLAFVRVERHLDIM